MRSPRLIQGLCDGCSRRSPLKMLGPFDRELDLEGCASGIAGFTAENAVVSVLNDLITDGQTHARALADGFSGEKRIKYAGPNRLGNARAIVSKSQLDHAANDLSPNPNFGLCDRAGPIGCFDRFDRIGQQMHKHLVDLSSMTGI